MKKYRNEEVNAMDFSYMIGAAMAQSEHAGIPFDQPGPEDLQKMNALATELYTMHLGRSYHGPAHPYSMFWELFGNPTIKAIHEHINLAALIWMIVLHDSIITVGTSHGWSERQSAQFAYKLLIKLGYSHEFAMFVKRSILATIDHVLDAAPLTERATIGVLLDLDLMGLGQEPDGFAADTESIWLEYKEHGTREAYDQGRSGWAKRWSKRRIYHTTPFKHLERQAKANLKALAAQG